MKSQTENATRPQMIIDCCQKRNVRSLQRKRVQALTKEIQEAVSLLVVHTTRIMAMYFTIPIRHLQENVDNLNTTVCVEIPALLLQRLQL